MTTKELDEHWFKSLLEMHDKGDKQAVRAAIVAAIKLYEREKERDERTTQIV